MFSFRGSSSFGVFINISVVFLLLFIPSEAQLCDSGDLSSTCVVNSPKSFNQNESFTGLNFIISSNVTCITSECSLEIIATQDLSLISGYLEAFDIKIGCSNGVVDSNSFIKVGTFGKLQFNVNELNVAGKIEGSYLNIVVNNNFDCYGTISANGYGHPNGTGRGFNGYIGQAGGGGGYGNRGMDACNLPNSGGAAYGSAVPPSELGSGGGYSNDYRVLGGSGGGFVYISASSFVINAQSTISSNGNPGNNGFDDFPNGAGGGSGGAIHIRTRVITISGKIEANGGNGGSAFGPPLSPFGNGGGAGSGGRIYINSTRPITNVDVADHITVDSGSGCSETPKKGSSVICGEGYGEDERGCRGCEEGLYSINGTCVSCPAGSFSNISNATSPDACTPCLLGTFSDSGATECFPCRSGFYSNSTGASVCFECPSGTISNSVNCTICPAGTYESGNVICYNCSSLSYSSPGSSRCTNCATVEGYVAINNTCEICPENTMVSTYGVCQNCSYGRYSSPGSTSCPQCRAGTYAPESGSGCFPCPPGHYSRSGASVCTRCSAGTYTSVSSSPYCNACTSNTYSGSAATSCIPCPSSSPYSNPGSSSCEKNPPKSSSSSSNNSGNINYKALSIALPISIVFFVIFIVVFTLWMVCRQQNTSKKSSYRYGSPPIITDRNNDVRVGHVNQMINQIEDDRKRGDNNNFDKREAEIDMKARRKNEELAAQSHNVPLPLSLPPPSLSSSSSSSSSSDSSSSYIPPPPPLEPSAPPSTFDNPPPQNPDFIPEPSAPAYSGTNVNNTDIAGTGTCLVCYERPKQVVFLPCGHVATCSSCSSNIINDPNPKCPICRTTITNTTRVYL